MIKANRSHENLPGIGKAIFKALVSPRYRLGKYPVNSVVSNNNGCDKKGYDILIGGKLKLQNNLN